MTAIANESVKGYRLRAKAPVVTRYVALGLLAASLIVVAISFYRGRTNSPFRLKSEHTQLSTDVTAEVNGYERLESDNGIAKYYVKADHAKTFSDNHQELENAYFEVYGDDPSIIDKMRAEEVLYVPEENKNFTAYMKGNVQIDTRDALKIKTNNIVYTKVTGTADADEAVDFEKDMIRGKSFGAIVKMNDKKVDLLKDVEIETFDSPELASSGVRYAKVNSNSATFDNASAKIDLTGSVAISIDSKSRTGAPVKTDANADRATITLLPIQHGEEATKAQVKDFQLFDSVNITTVENGGTPTNIQSGFALYDKAADRFELKDSVHIVTAANEKPTDIRADSATYDQPGLKMSLAGGAEVTQGIDYAKGGAIDADLFADRHIRYVVAQGDAMVRQTAEAQVTTVSAPRLEATFNDAKEMQTANALGLSTAQIVPQGQADYSIATVTAPRALHVVFKGVGLIDKMTTDGRTTMQLDVPNRDADAANKRVTADTVNTYFNANGKDIARAEAIGNAELYIEPLRAGEKNFKTTVDAPRFDCEFYPTGNNAKQCIGAKKTKTVRVPTIPKEDHGTQTLTSDRLTANFSAASKDIDSLQATGGAKFTELARTAVAAEMTFTSSDQTVRLRGGEPTAWDDRGRTMAREIDINTKEQHSYLRGGVSSTYYSREKIANAAPFASSDKPVFMTGDSAEMDHVSRTAVYAGNARGWQETSFVRGDRITIEENAGRLFAEGNVQSAVYDAKQKQKGKETKVTVFATARTMNYLRDSHLIQYRDNVDIRQGTDRLTSASADVYLDDKNELSKTVAENNVVITQPGRRATGNWVQYSSTDEIAVLRGTPAFVSDSTNGTSQASELTFMMRDNRVVSEAKTKPGTGSGRIRSTYKVDPKQ